jgi:tetratricopeptide (TPR) repeat protein
MPLFGNLHYRAAYSAYQERHWATAVDELARASRWEPLNGKYKQLHGEALINLGRYTEAVSAYERAFGCHDIVSEREERYSSEDREKGDVGLAK